MFTPNPECCRTSRRVLVTCLFYLLLCLGCGSGRYISAPVDQTKARETLQIALERWKQGETPESLQKGSPEIVVQDFDWSSGLELATYEIQGQGEAVDANLIVHVKLKLRDKAGQEIEKKVTYVVGTSPVLTVFRDMFN